MRTLTSALFSTLLVAPACTSDPDPAPPEGPPREPCLVERCEPIPRNLELTGASQRVAAGGEMTVLAEVCGSKACASFDAEFDVAAEGIIEIVSVEANRIRIRALSSGSGRVVLLRPADGAVFGSGDIYALDAASILEADAVYATGRDHEIAYRLRDADGEELIDEGMTFATAETGWEVIDDETLLVKSSTPGRQEIDTKAADGRTLATVSVDFAEAPDAIALVGGTLFGQDVELSIDPPIAELGAITAWTFAASLQGRVFLGAPWSVIVPDDLGPSVAFMFDAALLFRGEELGLFAFVVEGGGIEADLVIEVVPAAGESLGAR